METSSTYRPRVSRETRLLLTAGVMAVAVLWGLARIRFPDRPVTANPVPSVLSQLASGPKFDNLAEEIAQLHSRLQPSLLTLRAPALLSGSPQTFQRAAALRFRDDLAVAFVPPESIGVRWNDATILARDAPTGLAVLRVPTLVAASPPVPWAPRQQLRSRFLVASDLSPESVSFRPVFVGSLDPVDGPIESEPVWVVPDGADLTPGSFLFTGNADLAGLVIPYGEGLIVVPGSTVLAEAERLLTAQSVPQGIIGVEVQNLTPALAAATGADEGVVVTWVDADAADRKLLMAGDVIEAVDGQTLASLQQWETRVARLSPGATLSLRVRRRGEVRDVALVAKAPPALPPVQTLGLALRARPQMGAEVVRIDRGSAADRAGLAIGDVITLMADVSAPTPAHVIRHFNSMGPGARVLVAVTRGETHLVTVLER